MRNALVAVAAVLLGAGLAAAQPAPEINPGADAPMILVDESASPRPRSWASVEYLLWWFKDSPVSIPLLTTGPTGLIGDPTTKILLGANDFDTHEHSGGRFTAGSWLNDDRTVGMELQYLFFANQSAQQVVNQDGSPGSLPTFLPFSISTTGTSLVFPLNVPGVFSGLSVLQISTFLHSAETNAVVNVYEGDRLRLDALVGFRWLELREKLDFTNISPPTGGGIPGTVNFFDLSDTRNDFYAGQLGLRGELTRNRWFVNTQAKVALGAMHEIVRTNGFTQVPNTAGTALVTLPGGFLAFPPGSGRATQDNFAVMPELTIAVGRQIGRFARVSVGYNFLYISEVVRPGQQFDPGFDPAGTRPVALFNHSDFHAHGLSFGVDFRF